jgi:ubiquinone/menaquinone biosynthesis C-methylase UbiE
MPETPGWLRDKIQAYYRETTEPYYLSWAGDTLAFHVGLSEDAAPSRATGAPAQASAATPAEPQGSPDALAREESLLRMNAYLADRARIGTGTRVLDAGCGVGGSAIWLARERGADVTGITIEAGQVELARRFAAERGAAGVRFEQMDFSATSFGEAAFDVVWNIESLCHSADPAGYLRHVFELLDDGGRFACMDFFRGDGGNPSQCEAMCEGWVLPNLQSMEAVAGMLSEIGFTAVETEDVTPRVLPCAEMLRSNGLVWSVLYKLEAAAGKAKGPMGGKHFLAAVGAGEGLKSGSVRYGYVGATRPPRR